MNRNVVGTGLILAASIGMAHAQQMSGGTGTPTGPATGDLAGSNWNAAQIAPNAVTFGKFQTLPSFNLVGNPGTTTGNAQSVPFPAGCNGTGQALITNAAGSGTPVACGTISGSGVSAVVAGSGLDVNGSPGGTIVSTGTLTPDFTLVAPLANPQFGQTAFWTATSNLGALAGGGQSGATPLPSVIDNISGVAANGASVVLPATSSSTVGEVIVVGNSSPTHWLNVFPAGSDQINGQTGGAAVAVSPKTSVFFLLSGFSSGVGKWQTNPALIGTAGDILDFNAQGVTQDSGTPLSSVGSVTSVSASGGATGLTFSGGPVLSAGTLTLGGTLAVTAGGTGGTTSTGSGAVVLATSPTLVSPALGTPTQLVLTSATGLPIAGVTGLGSGVASALATNATGSGAPVLSTSPSIATPSITGLSASAAAATKVCAINSGHALATCGPNSARFAVGAPSAGTASTTQVMAGFGSTVTFTPSSSGTVNVTVTINDLYNTTAVGDGVQVQLCYGTGTAPANGAAVTGTVFGPTIKYVNSTTAGKVPGSITYQISGLTIGTTYYFDVAFNAVGGGTANFDAAYFLITEL
jgi:hypothetical protein